MAREGSGVPVVFLRCCCHVSSYSGPRASGVFSSLSCTRQLPSLRNYVFCDGLKHPDDRKPRIKLRKAQEVSDTSGKLPLVSESLRMAQEGSGGLRKAQEGLGRLRMAQEGSV